jgi:Histidine kinase-, DNA gyrase B-, and HSP90-like ATPase
LERTSKEAQRASEVIGRLRALLKHDKPKYTPLEINDIIKEVVTITQSALEARGITVRIDLPPGQPPALGDRVQLQQVLLNLIMNGADAMSLVASGRRILGLSSRVESSDDILVSIEDSGTGLEEGLSDRIFDPNQMAWGWAWRFANQSSKGTAAAFGRCLDLPMVPSFNSLCRHWTAVPENSHDFDLGRSYPLPLADNS